MKKNGLIQCETWNNEFLYKSLSHHSNSDSHNKRTIYRKKITMRFCTMQITSYLITNKRILVCHSNITACI